MGFFDKFKKSTSRDDGKPSGGGRFSIAAIIERSGTKPTIARCGVPGCGLSFASLGSLSLFTSSPESWVLDCGGFCPSCQRYVCAKHAIFKVVEQPRMYGVLCGPCGEVLCSSKATGDALTKAAYDTVMNEVEEAKKRDEEASRKLKKLLEMDEHSARLAVANAPNLRRYVGVVRQEASIDFPTADKERQALVEALARSLPKRELDDLMNRGEKYKAGAVTMGAFYTYLMEICERNDFDVTRYGAFAAYVAYIAVVEEIDRDAMSRELEQLST